MIAPWLLETLSREWNWRAALRRIAGELASPSPLSGLPRDHALACVDVARALEYVEPDRRFAIASYQQAGPEHDDGRALALAIEAGWWSVVGSLAMRERTATGSLEAMVWEARALIDTGEREKADKLLPVTPSDLRLASLRSELTGGSQAVMAQWVLRAQALASANPAEAAEAFLIAARQARALGRPDWVDVLRHAAAAEPGHAGVVAMMLEQLFSEGRLDSRSLLEYLRQRLSAFEARGDLSAWCDATRLAAMRLWLGSGAERHRGLARRLLMAALERAYREGATEISGHLAMWAVLDEAAAADQTRTELLGLVVSALDVPLPAADIIWLAALGAEICAQASNLSAAHAYAAVVVELAPQHPVVRHYYTGAVASVMPEADQLEDFRDALLQLDVQSWQELQIDEMAPLSMEDVGLTPGVVVPEQVSLAIESALESAVPVMDGEEVMESKEPWWEGRQVAVGTGAERALEASPGGDARGRRAHARAETVESGPIGVRGLRGEPKGEAGRVHARAETVESGPVGTRQASATLPSSPNARRQLAEGASSSAATSAATSAARAAPAAAVPSSSADSSARRATGESPLARLTAQGPAIEPSELDDGWGEPTPARPRRGSRSLESIPPILAALEAAAGAPSGPAPREPSDAVVTSPVRPLTGAVATKPVPRAASDALPTSQLRPPTGAVATAVIARLPLAPPSPSPSMTPSPTPSSSPTPPSSPTPSSSPTPPSPAARPSLIPSAVRKALAVGGKPRPLPPVPPPPSARPRARRLTIAMDLRVSVGGRELAMQSRDVSSSGLFAVTAAELPLGAELEGELCVPSSALSEERHRVRLRVIRRSKIGYGCALLEPSPELAAALAKLAPPSGEGHAVEADGAAERPASPAPSLSIPAEPPARGAT